ncbi:MAG: hypothetical protein QNL01_06450 [Akkermansiaceae bacterium]|jgi:hypothetical protein|tara:strand:- start:16100 stop:16327 length:228 start_codon:yes stop_codon:yes gene_type:complete
MKTIAQTEYEEVCVSGRPDDTISKIWVNPVKLFSLARFNPYAKRFIANALLIQSWGIAQKSFLLHLENRLNRFQS